MTAKSKKRLYTKKEISNFLHEAMIEYRGYGTVGEVIDYVRKRLK